MIELLKTSRVILYYNGAISGLTLFVQHPDESVCTPSLLPALSSVLEDDEMPLNIAHTAPADIVSAISNAMGLPPIFCKPIQVIGNRLTPRVASSPCIWLILMRWILLVS